MDKTKQLEEDNWNLWVECEALERELDELEEQISSMTPTMKIESCDSKNWRLNGKYHREDGPAIIWGTKCEEWYLNGKPHREDGPSFIGYKNKHYEWKINGKLHREDGPAVEHADGTREWWLNGKKHRLEGPAYTSKLKCHFENPQYWINGKHITKKQHDTIRKLLNDK